MTMPIIFASALYDANHKKVWSNTDLVDDEVDELVVLTNEKWHSLLDRVALLERENAELRESENESDTLRHLLSDKLARIAVALKSEPPALTLWSWHDLPELVAALAKEHAELKLSLETQAANFAELEQISIDNIGELAFAQFENKRFRAHIQELEIICSESYQVVGNLSHEHKVFCHKKTTKALDNLSQQKRIHHDVLPYQSASFEKDFALQPKEPT